MAASHSSSLSITREWIDGNSIQRLPPSPSSPQENYVNLDFAEELYGTILDIFSKIWHSWAGRSTALNNRQVKEVLARLRLWGRDFRDGKLACVLAQSDELRDTILDILCQIGKIIIRLLLGNSGSARFGPQEQMKNLRSLLAKIKLITRQSHDSDGISEDEDIQIISDADSAGLEKCVAKQQSPGYCHRCNRVELPEWRRGPDGAQTLCHACELRCESLERKIKSHGLIGGSVGHEIAATIKGPTTSSSSEGEPSSDDEEPDMVESLSFHVGCLMDLVPSMEGSLVHLQMVKSHPVAPVRAPFGVSEPARPFVQNISDKFQRADTCLVERLGESNWQRFVTIRARMQQMLCKTEPSLRTQAVSQKTPKANEDVRKFRLIQKASQKVYEALGRSCTKHTEHLTHFCLDAVALENGDTPQVQFKLAFTHLTLQGSASSGDPVWFLIESIVGTTPDKHVELGKDTFSLVQTLKRSGDNAQGQSCKKPKKSVRFLSTAAPCIPFQLPTATTDEPLRNLCMRKNFCDQLRNCFLQSPQAHKCLGTLDDTDCYKHLIYFPPPTVDYGQRPATSLEHVISTLSKQGPLGRLSQYDRFHLAHSLATAVLQYHATPWLKGSWRSEDIYFFGFDEQRCIEQPPDLSPPHLNVSVKGPDGTLSRASTFPPPRAFAPNPLLFGLGVLLLEIGYTATLESLKRPSDTGDGENRYTEFPARPSPSAPRPSSSGPGPKPSAWRPRPRAAPRVAASIWAR